MKELRKMTQYEIELVEKNRKLVYSIIRQKNIKLNDDIESVGFIGLIKAAQSYKKDKGKFSTYAGRCILNEIYMYFRKEKKYLGNISIEKQCIYEDKDGKELFFENILKCDVDLEEDYQNSNDLIKAYDVLLNNFKTRDVSIFLYYCCGMTNKDIGCIHNLCRSSISVKVKNIKTKMNKIINNNTKYDRKYKVYRKEDKIIVELGDEKVIMDIDSFDIRDKLINLIK